MAQWNSETIATVVNGINDETYVLPVIQRSLVWNEAKMSLLFDSLLKRNSFGGIMALEEEKGDSLLFAFRYFSRDGRETESQQHERLDHRIVLVIDGQQRLQTFYIGLMGSYNGKRLYFNLLSDEQEHDFRFASREADLPSAETNDEDRSMPKLWYPVKELFREMQKAGEELPVAEKIIRLREIESEFQRNKVQANIIRFYRAIFVLKALGISMVRVNKNEVAPERSRIVELFKRLNDGGTRLSALDLAASILKSFDYRMEQFLRDVREFNDIGISEDEVIKLIFLLQDNHTKEITQITQSDADFAISRQRRIIASLRATREFLKRANLYNYYNNGNRSDIPVYFIAYHLFHKNVPDSSLESYFENYDTLNPDFASLKRWIYLSLLNSVFSRGCGWIPYKTGIRKILQVVKQHKGQPFPTEEIFEVYKNHPLTFHAEVDVKHLPRWDADFVFYLIYDCEVVSGRDVDHVHPRSKLEAVQINTPNGLIPKYNPSQIHTIANYQLLDPGTNRDRKRAKTLAQWLSDGTSDRAFYLKRHLIPEDAVLWEIDNFETFLEYRAKAILDKVQGFIPEKTTTFSPLTFSGVQSPEEKDEVQAHENSSSRARPDSINDPETASADDLRLILERIDVPWGQRQLYSALYHYPDGLTADELVRIMPRKDRKDLAGVLGAFGRRINGTPGYGRKHKPGIEIVLEVRWHGDQYHYQLRPAMRTLLTEINPDWLEICAPDTTARSD